MDRITQADLRGLISAQAREGVSLEFKEAFDDHRSPASVPELLRDVASMANAEGGAFIYGMREDGEGTAAQLLPVPDSEVEADRLLKLCNTHIAERIPGLKATRVPIDGGSAVVVSVPTGYRRPHMITYNGSGELWIRHDRQKSRMSIAEVRSAILVTEDLAVKAETFMHARRRTLSGSSRLRYIAIGTPLLLQERLSVQDGRLHALLGAPPSYRGQGSMVLSDPAARIAPTVHGLRASGDKLFQLEIFRNGHVEYVAIDPRMLFDRVGGPPPVRLTGWAVAEITRNFVHLIDDVRTTFEISGSYLVALSLVGVNGVQLAAGAQSDRFGTGQRGSFQDGNDTDFEPAVFQPGSNPDHVAQHLTSRPCPRCIARRSSRRAAWLVPKALSWSADFTGRSVPQR